MPTNVEIETTANHLRIARMISSGRIASAEAHAIMKDIEPGGRYHGLPLLCIVDDTVEMNADARRIFTARPNDSANPPSAIVTQSTVMRVTINFISRVNGQMNTRLFATEGEAIRWLEETCAQKPKAATP